LISYILDTTDSYTLAFYIIAAIMIGSAVVAFIVRPPRAPKEERTAATPEGTAPAGGSGG
jgi:hypothetical protein